MGDYVSGTPGRCYDAPYDANFGAGNMRVRHASGFTLIELMVTVAIVAILAMIAIPSFAEQMRKSRRADAFQALGDIHLKQERWRSTHTTYGTLSEVGGTSPTADGYYTLTVATPSGNCANGTASSSANSYEITADTTGSQTADDGNCATIVLTNRCGIVAKTSTPAGGRCW